MHSRLAIFVLSFGCGIALSAQVPANNSAAPASRAQAGVYSTDQAMRGSVVFENNCAECHMSDLSGRAGPPLKGDAFMEHWRGKTVGSLFDKIRMTMPADWRTQLTETRALDVVSYLLQKNGFPAGSAALTVDAAGSVTIEDPNH